MNNIKFYGVENVKKIIIICGVVVFIIATNIFTGYITSRRGKIAYNKLETGFTNLEITNTELRGQNTELINNNLKLGIIQQRDADTIKRGQDIIREFKIGISESYDTIDRIETGFNTLEQLIIIIGGEGEILEK